MNKTSIEYKYSVIRLETNSDSASKEGLAHSITQPFAALDLIARS